MFGMQEEEVHQHQVQQSGVVRAEVHQGGAGTGCKFRESAADVGNSRVCPLAVFVHKASRQQQQQQ